MAEKEKVPECCKGCLKWEKFKEKCWIYWDKKKECTHHTDKMDIVL